MKAISKATLKHSKQMRLGLFANINFCLTDEMQHSGPNVKSWGLFFRLFCLFSFFLKGPILYSSCSPAEQPHINTYPQNAIDLQKTTCLVLTNNTWF